LAATALAALLGVGGGTLLRAEAPSAGELASADQAIVQALGAPTGILAVVNPVNCALTARDAAALNTIAAVPGVRVTVLLLALAPRDSVIRRVQREFGFSPDVALAAATSVNPKRLPEMFRRPFVAVVARGQLQHAAWGESLKSIHKWLPRLTEAGQPADAADLLTTSPGS
jgi:hypothetical protein